MDKESVLQKRNRAEHSSLLIVSAGFLLLCTCEVFGIITGKLWIGQRLSLIHISEPTRPY